MTSRHLEVIFCDDVRTEITGKQIYIGVYGSHLLVDEFPANLPSLSIIATAVTAIEDPFKKLVFRVIDESDGEVILEKKVPSELLPQPENAPENKILVKLRTTMVLPGIEFKAEGEIKVVMETESGIFIGGLLYTMRKSDFDKSLDTSQSRS